MPQGAPLASGKLPYGSCPRMQPVGAHGARVADVDDGRVERVQPQPETDQEDRQRRQRPGRQAARARLARSCAQPDPDEARDQVEHRRVLQRHRPEHEATLEVPERDRERQERDEVERAQRPDAPPVHQRDQEDRAEREPEPRVVELAPEPALVAARHRPGHLRSRPGVQHLARAVVDLDLSDLAVLLPRVHVHRPGVERRVVARELRVLVEAPHPVGDLGVAQRDADHRRPPRDAGCSRSANGR